MTDVDAAVKVVIDLLGGKPRRMVVPLSKDEIAALAARQAAASAADAAVKQAAQTKAALATDLRGGKLTLEQTQAAIADILDPEGATP